MELKWIATAAFAAALIPAAAIAQSKTSADSNASRSSTSRDSVTSTTVTSTSTGEVSSSQGSTVTPEMLKGQQDPNIIGSPAWWKSHATADGKPISGPPKE